MCKYMIYESAIINIRQRLEIPKEGFPSGKKALDWYRDHYHQARVGILQDPLVFNTIRGRGISILNMRSRRIISRLMEPLL